MVVFSQLVDLMDTLRGENGCPWDREQTRETLKPMLIEEAFEVIEGMESPQELQEELGDLLFQIVFHARIAKENGEFDIRDVVCGIYRKMVRRHPHVFGEQKLSDSAQVLRSWEEIKKTEKSQAGKPARKSILDGIPESLPALYQGLQLTSKTARVGFDWPDLEAVARKMREELEELGRAENEKDPGKIADEVGDILFVAVNLARRYGVDPETALARTNRKFRERFQWMEESFAGSGASMQSATLEELEARWQEAKRTLAAARQAGE